MIIIFEDLDSNIILLTIAYLILMTIVIVLFAFNLLYQLIFFHYLVIIVYYSPIMPFLFLALRYHQLINIFLHLIFLSR